MESSVVALCGAAGTVAFFACIGFASWVDYLKKKGESEAAHQERMKALEMGHPPLDAEIERAKAYASAAWAAGLIGLVVPLGLASLTLVGTIVAVLNHSAGGDITVPLVVAWSLVAVLVLVTVVRSLGVIRRLPRPTGETPREALTLEKSAAAGRTAFEARPSEMEI
jgi:hypothetical protein